MFLAIENIVISAQEAKGKIILPVRKQNKCAITFAPAALAVVLHEFVPKGCVFPSRGDLDRFKTPISAAVKELAIAELSVSHRAWLTPTNTKAMSNRANQSIVSFYEWEPPEDSDLLSFSPSILGQVDEPAGMCAPTK